MRTNKQRNTEMKTDFFRSPSPVPRSLKGGFTLFYSVLVSSLLLAIGLAILNIALKEFTLSSGARDSETAFYAADSALECALYWDYTQRIFGYYGDSLADGLLGYWRFEESAAQQSQDPPRIIDSSGSGRHGAVAGGAVWTDDGEIGNALTFDGVDDYAQVDSVSFEGPFTVSLWVKPTLVFTANNQIMLAGTYGRLGFQRNAETGVVSYRIAVNAIFSSHAMPTPLNNGGWHHLVLRRDEGNNVSIIVDNGASADISAGEKPGPFDFSFFGQNSGSGAYYQGGLDDIRAYNKALSDDEIQSLYNKTTLAGFVPPISQGTGAPGVFTCATDDINDEQGWWLKSDGKTQGWYSWDSSEDDKDESWTTEFDITFPNGTCGRVEVFKNDTGATTIISRGYNICDVNSARRLERALRAQY